MNVIGYSNGIKFVAMAIKPKCDKCQNELKEFGAILLSPPNKKSNVHKYHLCVECYEYIKSLINGIDKNTQ